MTGSASPGKLPLWRTVGQAYVLTLRHARELWSLSWRWSMWVIVPVVLSGEWYRANVALAVADGVSVDDDIRVFYSDALVTLLTIVPWAAVFVGWHRLLLLGEVPGSAPPLSVSRVVWRYAALDTALLLVLLAAIYMLAYGGVEALEWVAVGVTLAITVLLGRLYVLWPGVAIDDPRANLGNVWMRTRGHIWRLTLGLALTSVPSIFLAFAIDYVAATGTSAVLLRSLLSIVETMAAAIYLTFATLAYRHFFGGARDASRAA